MLLFETPFTSPAVGLRREIHRVFDDMISRSLPTQGWVPALDLHETESELVLNVELPGIDPEQVEITTDNGMLTIQGEKRTERKEGDERRYHLVERSYGSFTRSFRLPKGIDESKILADFDNGVLTVHIPKTALPQPKRVTIGRKSENGSALKTGEAAIPKA